MRFDTAGHQLAIEVRDGDALMAHFYTFNTLDYTLQQVLLPPEQSWWLGLEDAHAGMILLHGYGDRKLGQHKGIKAYAAASHTLQWELPDYSFYGVTAEGLLAFATSSPEDGMTLLEPDNGKILKADLNQQEAAGLVQEYGPRRYASCIFPVRYQAGESYFTDVSLFLVHVLAEEPVQAVEYAEYKEYIMVSYYLQRSDSKLDNYLAVFNKEGKLILKECLGQRLNGLGSDTFIIFDKNLYFVQHKDILRVYKLF